MNSDERRSICQLLDDALSLLDANNARLPAILVSQALEALECPVRAPVTRPAAAAALQSR